MKRHGVRAGGMGGRAREGERVGQERRAVWDAPDGGAVCAARLVRAK